MTTPVNTGCRAPPVTPAAVFGLGGPAEISLDGALKRSRVTLSEDTNDESGTLSDITPNSGNQDSPRLNLLSAIESALRLRVDSTCLTDLSRGSTDSEDRITVTSSSPDHASRTRATTSPLIGGAGPRGGQQSRVSSQTEDFLLDAIFPNSAETAGGPREPRVRKPISLADTLCSGPPAIDVPQDVLLSPKHGGSTFAASPMPTPKKVMLPQHHGHGAPQPPGLSPAMASSFPGSSPLPACSLSPGFRPPPGLGASFA